MTRRFLIGIDLGTTNSAVAYVDTRGGDTRVRLFEVPHYGRHGFDYWHQDEHGRLVAGGFRDVALEQEFTADEQVTDDVQRSLERFVSDLVGREVRIDYRWAGIFGLVLDFVPVVGPLTVRVGEEIRILPELAADAEESYFVIESAFQGNRLQVVPRKEQVVVSWFATAGTFESERTAAALTKTLDNVFTAPETVPPDGALSLCFVVRDQRGGTTWRHVPVVVTP